MDLLKHFHPRPGRLSFGQLNFLRGTKLRAIMSSPVVSVTPDTHMVELVYLLSIAACIACRWSTRSSARWA